MVMIGQWHPQEIRAAFTPGERCLIFALALLAVALYAYVFWSQVA